MNRQPVTVFAGLKVGHALISAGLLDRLEAGEKPYDQWGNEMGLDGALAPEMKIFLK